MIYMCENCKNRYNCCENKEQYEKTCEIIDTVARGIDKLPDCRSWYGITVRCDYWEEDEEMSKLAEKCKCCCDLEEEPFHNID